MKIIDHLPDCYASFLPDFFLSPMEKEAAADCENCPMTGQLVDGVLPEGFFSPVSKCCTHYPELPNYLLGALLSSGETAMAEGLRRIRGMVRSRINISPRGLVRPQKYSLLVNNAEKRYFGRSEYLICPLFHRQDKLCTIWPFHYGVCSSWFCKHNTGQDGKAFWQALMNYLNYTEKVLAKYVLHELGFEAECIIKSAEIRQTLTVADLDDKPPAPSEYSQSWQGWAGREIQFFREAYQVIINLDKEMYIRISGLHQQILLEDLQTKYQAARCQSPPRKLKCNPGLKIKPAGPDSYLLTGYSPLDPVEVPGKIYRILPLFDGTRTNMEICQLLEQEDKAVPDQDLLLSLYQLRILIEAE